MKVVSSSNNLCEACAEMFSVNSYTGVSIQGVRIWGSPWVPQHTAWRTAFNKSSEELQTHWKETLTAGCSVDVLVTHTPAKGVSVYISKL